MSKSSVKTAYRGTIAHCVSDPADGAADSAVEYFDDGLLLIENGIVAELGHATALLPAMNDAVPVVDYRGSLIVPGLIDCHVHFPQVDIVASYGEQLLDWLNKYAYPAEQKFADLHYATEVAGFFADELLRNGTTTAVVFATVHPGSVDAMFNAAAERNMRLVCGKVLMDRNCPAELRDSPESSYEDSRRLIEKWHGRKRLAYAITPRFAVTSSEEQLEAAGRLADEYPDVYIHTHLAENVEEVELIARQFPWSSSYLDVYKKFHLLRERSVMAHCLHLDGKDRELMAEKGSSIAFCPTSNLFLGSGLFDLAAANAAGIRVGVGSDVGGGTSLSILRTLSEAYKVLQLQQQSLPPEQALYLATLGAARALYLDDHIGNLAPGKEADFVVLNPGASALAGRRFANAESIGEQLFALIMLGDDRSVAATYVLGAKMRPPG